MVFFAGLVALVLTLLSLIGGLLNLVCLKMMGNSKTTNIIPTISTALTLCVVYICIALAFNDDIFRIWSTNANANLIIAITIFGMAGMLLAAVHNIFNDIYNNNNRY